MDAGKPREEMPRYHMAVLHCMIKIDLQRIQISKGEVEERSVSAINGASNEKRDSVKSQDIQTPIQVQQKYVSQVSLG